MRNVMEYLTRIQALICALSFVLLTQGANDEKKPETVIANQPVTSATVTTQATGISSLSIGLTFDVSVDNNAASQTPLVCKRLAKPMQSKNNHKPSLLIQAVRRRFFDALESLIREGGRESVNAQDKQGNTALHYAVMLGSESAVKKLGSFGARSDTPNNDGFTPLDIAYTRADFFQNNLFAQIALYLETRPTESGPIKRDRSNLQATHQNQLDEIPKQPILTNLKIMSEQMAIERTEQAPVIPDQNRVIENYQLHLQKERGNISCTVFYPGSRINGILRSDFKAPLTSFIATGHLAYKAEFAIAHKYLLATVAAVNQVLLSRSVSKTNIWHDLLSIVNKYIGITMGDAVSDCEQRWGQNSDSRDLLLELDEVIAGYTKENSSCSIQ